MKTHKIISAAAALLLAAAMCLTSCGDDDSSSGSGSGDTSQSAVVSGAESDAGADSADGSGKDDDSSAAEDSTAAVPADTSAAESSDAGDASAADPTDDSSAADGSSEAGEPVEFSGRYVGKWELYEMDTEGVTVKGVVFGQPVALLFQFEFKDDGTVEMMQSDYGKDIKRAAFKYTETENGVSVLGNTKSSALDFTLENGLLVCSMEKNSVIKLCQVSEFTKYDPGASSQSGNDIVDSTPADSLSEEDVFGKWELAEMSVGGMTISDSFTDVSIAKMFQFEFKTGGKGTLSRDGEERSGSLNFSWEIKKNKLYVTVFENGDSETVKFSYKNGLLVSDNSNDPDETVIKITHVDEFTA